MSKGRRISKIRPRICFLDLEATALDADVGYLVGGGFLDEKGRFRWFYAKTPRDEKDVIISILDYLNRHHIFFTWNGSRFDVPFLTARAIKHNLRADLIYKPTHIDLADFIRNHLKISFINLYHVARFFNISKNMSIQGLDVPSLYLRAVNGDKKAAAKIKKHCKDDLDVLRRVFLKVLPVLREVKPELTL
ncbi:MAG: ribonuclease H-like domain-containing protein [Aigarchaeota archaeon]|nr:ribonuclease H-like domain-containing protein [Aigarchaeota archaeon]MCX8192971.1 ribonuclease H-like domain-containing protein [Nitrososphaeria archaeon]MDW7986293.1 ribonuclease H-like domain-containing protein [Nitrososphaerota archaeon]